MLIFKSKSKNSDKTYINFIIDRTQLKDCKNSKYCRYSVSIDYIVGLSNKKQSKIGDLNLSTLEIEQLPK